MELRILWQLLRRSMGLILGLALLGALSGLAISQIMTPLYAGTTLFLVTVRSGTFSDVYARQRITGTYLALARTNPILDLLRDQFQLSDTYEELNERITLGAVPDTMLIELAVTDSDPQRASEMANALVFHLRDQGRVLLGSDPEASRAVIQVVEPSQPDFEPVQPRMLRNLILTTALGGMLGVGLVFLNYHLDPRPRSREQIEALIGAQVVTTIPYDRAARRGRRFLGSDPQSTVYEAYRTLQAMLDASNPDASTRIITITSVLPNDGKSWIAVNIAVLLAQRGKRVIVVDADRFGAGLESLLDHTDAPGLSDVLHSPDQLDQYLQATELPGLQLLPRGRQLPHLAHNLDQPTLQALCDGLTARADWVIFDGSALLTAVDSALLARVSDSVLVALRPHKTSIDDLREVGRRLAMVNDVHIHLLLNNDQRRTSLFLEGMRFTERRQRLQRQHRRTQLRKAPAVIGNDSLLPDHASVKPVHMDGIEVRQTSSHPIHNRQGDVH